MEFFYVLDSRLRGNDTGGPLTRPTCRLAGLSRQGRGGLLHSAKIVTSGAFLQHSLAVYPFPSNVSHRATPKEASR